VADSRQPSGGILNKEPSYPEEETMKRLLRGLIILAAPIVWRKIRERRRRGRDR
jgi:hypothetical protein